MIAQLAGAVEYTNCFSAEGGDPRNKFPRYDTKQSDGKIPVMLDLWDMQSTSSLTSLPGQLWPGVVVPDRVLCVGQIELNCVPMLNWIAWNRIFFIFKLHESLEIEVSWHLNCVLILNWIVWSRTVWLNWIAWNRNVFISKVCPWCNGYRRRKWTRQHEFKS